LCSNNLFFLKFCRLKDNVEEYRKARQVTDDNMGHKYRMLDNKDKKTPSGYETLTAFPVKQWLYESASMLR
jgi:hypothetical protein